MVYFKATQKSTPIGVSVSGTIDQKTFMKKIRGFFSNYIPVFQQYNYFKTQGPIPTSTRRRHQMGVDDHRLLFLQICETNSETRFSLKFVNDEPSLRKLAFVSFL